MNGVNEYEDNEWAKYDSPPKQYLAKHDQYVNFPLFLNKLS